MDSFLCLLFSSRSAGITYFYFPFLLRAGQEKGEKKSGILFFFPLRAELGEYAPRLDFFPTAKRREVIGTAARPPFLAFSASLFYG